MISVGVGVLLCMLGLFVLCMIGPVMQWLEAVAFHRRSQGESVLHHAGLLDQDEADA